MCRSCAKLFCKYRDKKKECSEKITYVQANILDKPERRRDVKNKR